MMKGKKAEGVRLHFQRVSERMQMTLKEKCETHNGGHGRLYCLLETSQFSLSMREDEKRKEV